MRSPCPVRRIQVAKKIRGKHNVPLCSLKYTYVPRKVVVWSLADDVPAELAERSLVLAQLVGHVLALAGLQVRLPGIRKYKKMNIKMRASAFRRPANPSTRKKNGLPPSCSFQISAPPSKQGEGGKGGIQRRVRSLSAPPVLLPQGPIRPLRRPQRLGCCIPRSPPFRLFFFFARKKSAG